MELAACIGDIAMADDGPALHAHVVLGRRDGTAPAGRLKEPRVPDHGGDPGRVPAAPGQARSRADRLTADTTAFSDAVAISGSMPTPHSCRPSTLAST